MPQSPNRIDFELNKLTALLDSKEKVTDIVTVFIDGMVGMHHEVDLLIQGEKWNDLRYLLHKLQPRFSYLGFDETVELLFDWEVLLEKSRTIEIDSQRKLQKSFARLSQKDAESMANSSFYTKKQFSSKKAGELEGKIVLLAEDDEITAMLVEQYIRELGAEVILVNDGAEAVQSARSKMPDMILMDINLQVYSGLEALSELREAKIDCTVVLLSGSTQKTQREKALELGAAAFLSKPVKQQEIEDILLKYLSRN